MDAAAPRWFTRLRVAALSTLATGALVSVALVLYAGRRNRSHTLIAMFVVWVLAPYAALAFAEMRAGQWPSATRTALYALMLIIPDVSVALYAWIAFGPPRPQAAFAFVIVPPIATALIAAILGGAALAARRARRDGGP